jgi:hypothetical protein
MMDGVLLATLNTLQTIGLVAVTVTGVGGLLFASVNAWLSVANERKRTQPIVIAHEAYARRFAKQAGCFDVGAYLTNEGSGAGFNVRFGVEFHRVRFPYKHSAVDHDTGSVQRVLRPAEQRPASGVWPILVDAFLLVGETGDPDPKRVYWARYENAQGKVWETRNPGDRSEHLDIKRVRLLRLRQRLEQRRRNKARQHGAEWERAAIDELQHQPAPAPGAASQPESPEDPAQPED